jgi:NADH-quinone oxidoreductase subunit K
MIPTSHYVVVSLLLFTTGVIGVLTRRNVIIILMSIELILNAVNINLVAFSHHLASLDGQIFAIFIITDAAAEAAVGLASSSPSSATGRRCWRTKWICCDGRDGNRSR